MILQDYFLRAIFYLLIVIIILSVWASIKKYQPKANLFFLTVLFFYRIPFIWVYLNYIPGDWEYYILQLKEHNTELVIGTGTSGVVWIASFFQVFSLSSFEFFFLFSLFGYFAIVLFYLMIHNLTERTDRVFFSKINVFPWILLYPSLHMYTSMLGKDPTIFFGIALATYSLSFKKIRWIMLLIGLTFMILVRPHMAAIFIACLYITLLFNKDFHFVKRWVLVVLGIIGAIIIIPQLIGLFRVEELSFQAIQVAIELNEGYVSEASTYVDMTNYPILLKMFTYLFRPLFIDSPNKLLLEYSLENLIFLVLFVLSLRIEFFSWIKRQPLLLKFSFVYFIIGAFVLSNGLTVFGLIIRQKTMIFLNLILLMFSFMYYLQTKQSKKLAKA